MQMELQLRMTEATVFANVTTREPHLAALDTTGHHLRLHHLVDQMQEPPRLRLHIEKLPEGVYLATCADVQGLVAQGRTIQETIEIARDVAKKLIESQASAQLPTVAESFDYSVIVAI